MDALLKALDKLNKNVDGRSRLFVIGVFIPGFLLSVEFFITYMLVYYNDLVSITEAKNFLDGHQSILFVVLFATFILSVSCVLGYLNRDITFSLSNKWLASDLPPNRLYEDIRSEFEAAYGMERVQSVLSTYPIFRVKEAGGAARLSRPPEFYIREFCKLWLSVRRPTLNTDGLEVEINVMMGLVAPTVLSAVPLILALQMPTGAITAALVLVSGIAMLHRINKTRCLETEMALLNFLFAHWVDDSVSSNEGETLPHQNVDVIAESIAA